MFLILFIRNKANKMPPKKLKAEEKISKFLNSFISEKERNYIYPHVVRMNRDNPINAQDEHQIKKRVDDIIKAVQRQLMSFNLFTKDDSHSTSRKYNSIRSYITNKTKKDNDFGFNLACNDRTIGLLKTNKKTKRQMTIKNLEEIE